MAESHHGLGPCGRVPHAERYVTETEDALASQIRTLKETARDFVATIIRIAEWSKPMREGRWPDVREGARLVDKVVKATIRLSDGGAALSTIAHTVCQVAILDCGREDYQEPFPSQSPPETV